MLFGISVCFFLYLMLLCFFFFKQKTAYEMRISDWSSDVCSSDLEATRKQATTLGGLPRATAKRRADFGARRRPASVTMLRHRSLLAPCLAPKSTPSRPRSNRVRTLRSEEHTSELQSLMRIPYAVFCLQKKKN